MLIFKRSGGIATPPNSEKFNQLLNNTKETFISQNHHAAVLYAEQFGFYVFPVVPRGKNPLTSNGFKDASRELNQLSRWWGQWPDASIGISCGHSGLDVIDIDRTADMSAEEALVELEQQFGSLPTTPHVLTGGGGFQFYFRSKDPINSKIRLLKNVDLKSAGGYVIAPPSIHATGKMYSWELLHKITDLPIADSPSWLKDLNKPIASQTVRPLNFWCDLFKNGLEKGARNDGLTKLAGYFFRKNVDAYLVKEIITLWNSHKVRPSLSDDEIQRTIDSVARLEVQRRGGIYGA